jgi:GDSL-like lipase/acylhydrolase family protein
MSRIILSRSILAFTSAVSVATTACTSDRIVGPTRIMENQSDGRGAFQRYFAIGTSVSAGVQSDGLIAATQATSWPAQLSTAAGRTLAQPYVDGTGCRSPLMAPLASGTRISGEPAGQDPAQLSCSPLRSDVFLPVDNVGLNGARAHDALYTTAQNITDPGNAKIYARVLQPGQTQISTMMAANPKLVSIELGANEVLNARSGIAMLGVDLATYDEFVADYDKVLDSVQKVTKMAVVVGLIDDLGHAAAFRSGNEIWNDRAEFLNFNIVVSADCQNNENLIFVPVRIPLAAAAGQAMAKQGPYTFRCAAGETGEQDFVLTPAETNIVNELMHAMTTHIQAEAARRGFAYFALGTLYDRDDIKTPTFSIAATLLSANPFGDYFSLDGLHPSALGQTILARAAARALNDTYDLGIPLP